MSYLSASGNVGYSGLSQISDASCATQYKMVVDGAGPVAGGEDEDLSYFPHVNEHLFSSKFKVDATELFTFQEADGVAGEITVCDDVELKPDSPRCPATTAALHITNGLSNDFTNSSTLTNGHVHTLKTKTSKVSNRTPKSSRSPSRGKNLNRANSISEILASVGPNSPPGLAISSPNSPSINRNSIISVSKEKSQFSSTSNNQSFLDVFKREMGTFSQVKNPIKKDISLVPVCKPEAKPPVAKKIAPANVKPVTSTHRANKSSSASGGRGPAHHEALQRIPPAPPAPIKPATVQPHSVWHAPGPHAFECTPLTDTKHSLPSSSSDDDADMPNFGSWVLTSADDAEAGGGDARGARLAARRATLRRQVAHAATALRLASTHHKQARLAHVVKKHIRTAGAGARLPPHVLGELLASRGMDAVLSSTERRRLRAGGWSGIDNVSHVTVCATAGCEARALPCTAYCLAHVTLAPEQRLYTSCAAVFAGGSRCQQSVLQLHDQTPLCQEHAWKRDNYDKLSRETKPKKVAPPRKRLSNSSATRRAKRRRRPPPPPAPLLPPALSPQHTLLTPELNVCSNSSTYDSSEDTGIGGLSETEFMAAAADHDLDVGVTQHVLEAAQTPDDMLDSSVLHQIPDEAFTEFFNQTGGSGGAGFGEEGSEELARALEAVLDERVLDSLADCVFTQPPSPAPLSTQHKVSTSRLAGVEMSSIAPS